MREFAGEVIRFLREYYDDAYRYNITLDTGVYWKDAMALDIMADHLTIHIPPNQMYSLYELFNSHNNEWQDRLQELIEM